MKKVAVRSAGAVFSLFIAGLVGCGTGIGPTTVQSVSSAPIAASAGLSGTVHGGSQVISNAMVQLWTVGTTGYGSAGSVLATTYTSGTGSFSFAGTTCSPTKELVYVTATNGNPGLSSGTNADMSLMTALGPCNTIAGTKIEIDEATTVASVWALAQFMSSNGNVGSYSSSTVGITNAFATVHNLVDTTTGAALAMTPAGNGLVPQAEINTLANILASCVNSSGSTASGQPCPSLFSATTHGSSVPANTLQAALNMALYPAGNPSGQFGLVTTTGPFQPTLTAAPNDWAMPVLYAGTGPLTQDLAIDASGNIWTANYGGQGNGSVSELTPTGQTFPNSPYLYGKDGWGSIAIDLGGDAWVGNYTTAQIEELAPAGASSTGPLSFPETSSPDAIAVDGSNDIWIANSSSGTVTEMSNAGATSRAVSPTGGYSLGSSSSPSDVAIDANGDAWVTEGGGSSALSKITPSGNISSSSGSGLNQPAGVAIDRSGDLWVTDSGTSNVAEFNSGGTQTLTASVGNGLVSGSFDAVDGLNNIWTANSEIGNSLAEFNSSGTLLSPSGGTPGTGFKGPTLTIAATNYSGPSLSSPFAVSVDQSGNVWVGNQGTIAITSNLNAGVTEFIGLGAPTIQPLALAVQQGLIGKLPGTSPGSTLTVTSGSLPTGVQTAKYSYQLLAKGGTGNGYTWQVTSGGTTLSNVGLSLSSSGLLSGTLSGTVSGASIGFKVTDSGGNTATTTLSLTVNALTSLSITTTNIASATVGTNYNQLFAATGGSGSYTWSIPGGTQLTALNNDGFGYGPSGNLSGKPTSSGNFPFTIQVTDLATGQTASAPYTLVVNNATLSQCTHDGSGNALLNGHYAFLLTGFDSSGNVLDQIGSFKADGAGNIGSGMGDQNNSGYATQGEQSYTFSGTYSIGSTDDRGQMVLSVSNNVNTQYFCFAADTVTSGVAYSGRIIEATGDGTIQTGVFQIQNTADFTASGLTGGYAFGLQGENSGTPLQRGGLIGQMTLNGSGSVSSGQVDIATYKSSTTSTTYTSAATLSSGGTYTMGSGGRGTLNISAGGGGGSFIIYQFGNGNGFFMLSSPNINSNTLLAGYAMQQTQTNFTTANVAAKGVFRKDGLDVSRGSGVDNAEIGQLGFDGSGNLSFIADQNDGGTITAASGVLNANYTVTSLGYLTVQNAGGNGVPSFYLYGAGGGFGLDASNSVGLWVSVPQTGAGSFSTTSLNGSYGVGTVNPLAYSSSGAGVSGNSPYPSVLDAAATFNSGTISLVQDEVQSPGTVPYVATDQTQSQSYTLDPTYGASTGRFTIGGSQITGYIVSPTQAILMQTTSGKDPAVILGDHQ